MLILTLHSYTCPQNWFGFAVLFLTVLHNCLVSAWGWAARSAEETEGNRRWAGQVLGGPEGCSGETGTVGEEGHRCEFTTKTPSETHYPHYSGTPQPKFQSYKVSISTLSDGLKYRCMSKTKISRNKLFSIKLEWKKLTVFSSVFRHECCFHC